MGNEECYIQDPQTGLFRGSRPGCAKKKAKSSFIQKLQAKVKRGKRREVYHTEFATPDKVEGDVNEYRAANFRETARILTEHDVKITKDAIAKHDGDGFFIGDASQYGPTGNLTSKGKSYEKVPDSVAINRIFGYQTEPKTRNKYVVVGDMEKDNGAIQRRDVTDTGMYGGYTDEKGVYQKYPHPTNIVDFHPESLNQFAGKPNCDKRKIMMKTCESPEECTKVASAMRERINKWRKENAKKEEEKKKKK